MSERAREQVSEKARERESELMCDLVSERVVPAVVEGGPGRRQRQALAQLVPLPGHLTELEEHGVQVVARRPVVVHGGRGRGGRLAVHGRT